MGRVLSILAAVGIVCGGAQAEDAWLTARQTEFALWQKANPTIQNRISRLKTRTAVQLKKRRAGNVADAPVVFRVPGAITQLWDAAIAPKLTIVPAGEFTMGSPASEPDRQTVEGPQHRVRISQPLAVGTYPVTRNEYYLFVADTQRPDPAGCMRTHLGDKGEEPGFNWHNPGFEQSGSEPVVCVSWEDARDYAAWLSKKTGARYRLLSEAEWEFASRAGTTTIRPWGNAIGPENANYRGASPGRSAFTAPVGSYPPNAFGISDPLGNVWQRLDDCWKPSFDGAPSDGSVWLAGDCSLRTGHGGAFDAPALAVRSAFRGKVPGTMHYSDGGFRIAREL